MPFSERQSVQTIRTCTACGKKKNSTSGFKSVRIDAVNLYSSVLSLSLPLCVFGVLTAFSNTHVLKCFKECWNHVEVLQHGSLWVCYNGKDDSKLPIKIFRFCRLDCCGCHCVSLTSPTLVLFSSTRMEKRHQKTHRRCRTLRTFWVNRPLESFTLPSLTTGQFHSF